MPDPGGRTVGRVSLRVLPDTSKLREDLSKVLRRIEATMKVTIPADLDTSGFLTSVRTAVAEAERVFKVTATADLDSEHFRRQVRDAIRDASGQTITINADLDAALARLRLSVLTRPRFVDIIARVNSGSLSRALTALAALSGARSAGNIIERIGRALGNLDKSLPAISGVVLALGTLTAAAFSSVAGLFAIGASLASIAATAIALPGVLAGFAVGTTVLVLALLDIKKQLGSLAPAFANLQNVVSATFWEGARRPILDLVNSVLPALQVGMKGTAKALGGLFANLASSLQSALGGGVLAGMFDSLNASIDIAAQAMEPLAAIIATLGTVGAAYLPGLAARFVSVTDSIADVTLAAAADGRLKGWIDGGIAAAGDLFSALGAIGRILYGINEAAQAAGAGGLKSLATNLHLIADVINGPAFQGALTSVFLGAGQAMDGVAKSLGPLGALFTSLAPTIAYALASIGTTVGEALSGVANALADPAVSSGIIAFVQGLQTGIRGLLPALTPLAQALGAVLGVAGTLASILGPVLGAAFSALAPVVVLLASTLTPLIELLGGALVGVIGQVAPLLAQLAGAVLPVIASVIAALVPALVTVISSVLPVIAALIPPVAAVLGLVAGAIVTLLPVVAGLVAQLVGALAPVITTLVEALLPVLAEVFAAIIPVLVQLLPALGNLIAVFVTALMPTIEALLPLVATVFNALVPIITAAVAIITGIVNVFAGIISGNWSLLWTGVKQILSGAWDLIVAIIKGAIGLVVGILQVAWALIVVTVKQAWSEVTGLVSSAWESLKAVVRDGIVALINFVGPGLLQMVGFFRDLRGNVLGALGDVGSWLVDSGKAIIDGLVRGIRSAASRVTDAVSDVLSAARAYFPFSPAKKGPFSGKGWTKPSGASLVDGMVSGIKSRQDNLVAATASMMAAAQPLLSEISSASFQTPAAAAAAAVSGPSTFNLYDADKQLIGTMQGIAQGSVRGAADARLVATRMGAA